MMAAYKNQIIIIYIITSSLWSVSGVYRSEL